MLKLLYSPGACSLALHIVLEWVGTPYEAQRVKLGSKELLAVNPAGSVPVLLEGDWVLAQAGAILQYLARKFPDAALGGDPGDRGQAEVDRWSAFFTGDVHPSFYPVFMADRYTTERSDEALAAVRNAGLKLVAKRFKILEQHLSGRPYILGERRSIVDAYAFPMLRWGSAKLDGGLSDFPNLVALHERIAADEGVKKVLESEAAS